MAPSRTSLRRSALGGAALLVALAAGASWAGGSWGARDAAREGAFETAIHASQRRLARKLNVWRDHGTWDDPFRASSPSYVVTTTTSGRLAREVAQGLEAMLPYFQKVLGSSYRPDPPQAVRIYPTLEEYNAVGEQYGTEDSSVLGAFHATEAPGRPLAVLADRNHLLVKMWATHAAALEFLDGGWDSAPPVWISRGLASYFSLYWDFPWGAAQLRRYQEQGRYVPLDKLLRESLAAYVADPDPRFCQLGMLFSYLLDYRDQTRNPSQGESGPFADYLRLVLGGRDPRQHPVHALLTADLAQLERDFRAFDFGG